MSERDGRGCKSQTSSSIAALIRRFSTRTCRLKSKANSHKCKAVCAVIEVEAADFPSEGIFSSLPAPSGPIVLWNHMSKCK